jgi:hypothetical protein
LPDVETTTDPPAPTRAEYDALMAKYEALSARSGIREELRASGVGADYVDFLVERYQGLPKSSRPDPATWTGEAKTKFSAMFSAPSAPAPPASVAAPASPAPSVPAAPSPGVSTAAPTSPPPPPVTAAAPAAPAAPAPPPLPSGTGGSPRAPLTPELIRTMPIKEYQERRAEILAYSKQ